MPAPMLQFCLGMLILIGGSELLVRGSVSLGKVWRFPAVFLGLILVGYGSALPEWMIVLHASAANSPDIALGTVIGSVIANSLLVIGGAAMLSGLTTAKQAHLFECMLLLGAVGLFLFLASDGLLSADDGLLLVLCFSAYTIYQFRQIKQKVELPTLQAALAAKTTTCSWCAAGYALIGLSLLFTGVDMTVDGAVKLARYLHVSEATIGLTAVATACALPELACALWLARRRHTALAISVAINANLFTLLGISGISFALNPVLVAPSFFLFDLWFMATLAAGLFILARIPRLPQPAGCLMVALFALYAMYHYVFSAHAASRALSSF